MTKNNRDRFLLTENKRPDQDAWKWPWSFLLHVSWIGVCGFVLSAVGVDRTPLLVMEGVLVIVSLIWDVSFERIRRREGKPWQYGFAVWVMGQLLNMPHLPAIYRLSRMRKHSARLTEEHRIEELPEPYQRQELQYLQKKRYEEAQKLMRQQPYIWRIKTGK